MNQFNQHIFKTFNRHPKHYWGFCDESGKIELVTDFITFCDL